MNWLGIGITAHVLTRIAELQSLSFLRVNRQEPDQELPDVELPPAEQQAAIDSELTRRWEVSR